MAIRSSNKLMEGRDEEVSGESCRSVDGAPASRWPDRIRAESVNPAGPAQARGERLGPTPQVLGWRAAQRQALARVRMMPRCVLVEKGRETNNSDTARRNGTGQWRDDVRVTRIRNYQM